MPCGHDEKSENRLLTQSKPRGHAGLQVADVVDDCADEYVDCVGSRDGCENADDCVPEGRPDDGCVPDREPNDPDDADCVP